MWLLKLHFSISVLCLLTFVGFKHILKDTIKENGYIDEKNTNKKRIFNYWIFFIPFLNVIVVIMEFVMFSMKKSDLEKWCEEHKKKENE